MKEQKEKDADGLSWDGRFWEPIWRLIRLLIRYSIETFIAVVIFAVLVLASRATRSFNTYVGISIPELTKVFKYLEFFLLAMGVILFGLFIFRNTVGFAMVLLQDIRDLFTKNKKSPKKKRSGGEPLDMEVSK